jgi:glycosyltransferase involved in cell wall biosynthesis
VVLLPNCVESVATVDDEATTHQVGTLRLGYAGSVLTYEGLDLLVAALGQLRAEGLDIRLTVAGGGAALAALQDTVRAADLGGAVQLLGRVTPLEANALLAGCDAVALPRLPLPVCEAVPPIKLVEAMALGKPVVAPDLAAFRDEIDDGVTGLLFKAGDVDSLTAALRRLATEPLLAARLGAAARARVAETRTWKRFAETIAEKLARGRQPHASAPTGSVPQPVEQFAS